MSEIASAVLIFLCLLGASLGSLLVYQRLPQRHRSEETHNVVKLLAGLFTLMTSLVLGLMINSAKNTFESVDRNMHAYATQFILLDRSLRELGPRAEEARRNLATYLTRVVNASPTDKANPAQADRASEQLLRNIADDLRVVTPAGAGEVSLLADIGRKLDRLVEQRWVLVEQSEGTLPTPLIGMLVAWLMLIFASFGYRAPENIVVGASFVLSAALLSGAIYLILDMDVPFSGPIQISLEPLNRALAEVQR